MTTTADELLDEIRELAKSLKLKTLHWYVSEDIWGRKDYTDAYEEKVMEVILLIDRARKLLN